MPDINLEACIESLEETGDYRIVKCFEPVEAYHTEETDETKPRGLYVDVETTGLNTGTDKIIELPIVAFEFLLDGRIFRIIEQFDQFQDPGFPIPEGITALPWITDAMVEGGEIDETRVNQLVESASVVIAHNATFDGSF